MMKHFFILFVLIGSTVFGQDAPSGVIEKKDGTLLEIRSLGLNFHRGWIEYVNIGETRIRSLKFKEVNEINHGASVFRVFGTGEGYYVITESETKVLATVPILKFSEPIEIEVFVLEKSSGKVLERFMINKQDKKKAGEKRAEVKESIKRNFADCPKFLEYFSNFEKDSDTSYMQIWNYLAMKQSYDCNK